MPLAKALSRLICCALLLGAASCAVSDILPVEDTPALAPSAASRMPREILSGASDMVVAQVEPEVSRTEVLAAVQSLVEQAPLCFPWPGLWIDPGQRRSIYIARYDLMTRDWGEEVAAASRQRMQEFVDLGFLTQRDRPEVGPNVVEYALTSEGTDYLRGSPYGAERPIFCAPSQRRVVEITRMDFGRFPCGNLQVGFTHTSDAWPTWARNDAVRMRVAGEWGAPGAQGEGTVSLGRQWFRRGELPPGMTQNGALRSVCYDAQRQRTTGDDLALSPPAALLGQ
jgi:hypothetical protein